jgi:hypothetical protein
MAIDVKRYAVDLDLWVYGKTEREAKINLHDLIKKIRKLSDNDANIQKMTQVPFGMLGNNKVVSNHYDPREKLPF